MEGMAFWTGRRIAIFLLIVLAAIALWYGVRWLLQKDEISAERPSPDGRLVARIWCEGPCRWDRPTFLTISAADRDVGRSQIPHDPSSDLFIDQYEGHLPRDDVVTSLRSASLGGTTFRWTGTRALLLSHICLTDAGLQRLTPRRFKGVDVALVSETLPASFRGGIGQDLDGTKHYMSEEIRRCEERGNN